MEGKESRKKKGKEKEISLGEEAVIVHPIIFHYYGLFQNGEVSNYDLAAIYILVYLAMRRPHGWSNGKLKAPIIESSTPFNSLRLSSLTPQVIELLDLNYVARKLKLNFADCVTITLIDLFNELQLLGMKSNTHNYINNCMVHWAIGARPFRLMTYIPTPTEVLHQQARGERVVTLFTTIEELSRPHTSKLTYMSGMPEHARDPLEFLLHDLKHMEHFTDKAIFHEQIGFFASIRHINQGKVKTFFVQELGYSKGLWHELEYVISDM
jgi:hypothetical protein